MMKKIDSITALSVRRLTFRPASAIVDDGGERDRKYVPAEGGAATAISVGGVYDFASASRLKKFYDRSHEAEDPT